MRDLPVRDPRPIVLGWFLDAGAQSRDRSLRVGAGPFAKEETFGHECVEDLGVSLCQSRRLRGCEQIRSGRSWSHVIMGEMDWELVKHAGHIVLHVNLDSAGDREIKSHSKIVMDLSTSALNGSVVAIHFVKPFIETVIDLGFEVTGH